MKRSGHESRSFTTVIGDVVGSRKHSDQRSLFEHLDRALSWVNERVAAVQDLQITVGDEFQGVYHDLGRALDAALLVRLRVWDSCHLRFGLGTGEIDSFKPESRPFSQSGSAWWRRNVQLATFTSARASGSVCCGWVGLRQWDA